MNQALRWPLHPPPAAGEALSSWITRLAEALTVPVSTLIETADQAAADRNLDDPRALSQWDVRPPAWLIPMLHARTGVPARRIRAMSLAGWCPDLLGTPGARDQYSAYTHHLSILLPPGRRRKRSLPGWQAWIPTSGPIAWRACPSCLARDGAPGPYQLHWVTPLLATCPVHHTRLHDYGADPPRSWPTPIPGEPAVSAAITAMDSRTWQALTTGHTTLPVGRIQAGTWLRILRTILDELSTTLPEAGSTAGVLRQAWDLSGQPPRAGQHGWRPFEDLPAPAQAQMQAATATALQALEHGRLAGRGRHTGLLHPAGGTRPHRATPNGCNPLLTTGCRFPSDLSWPQRSDLRVDISVAVGRCHDLVQFFSS